LTDGQWLYILAMEKALKPESGTKKYIVKRKGRR